MMLIHHIDAGAEWRRASMQAALELFAVLEGGAGAPVETPKMLVHGHEAIHFGLIHGENVDLAECLEATRLETVLQA
jgi:hypothetical protein